MDSEIITDNFSEGEEEDFSIENEDDDDDDDELEYTFDWKKNVPLTPNFPVSNGRKTVFTSENLSVHSTPFEILLELLTPDILSNICAETCAYVEKLKDEKENSFKTWTPIETPELCKFLGLNLLMGLIKKPTTKDYWTSNHLLSTPQFNKIMSRQRFEDILRGLHFCNNDDMDFSNDRLLKLGTFLPKLTQNFKSIIIPGERVCLDESLLKWLGRLNFKQCIRTKRARFGIKIYILADCETNFIIGILVYQGKNTKLTASTKDYGAGGATVITLMDDYMDDERKMTVDNYFNSPKLANFLLNRNTMILGTVRKNRKNMPKMTAKLNKGDVEYYTSDGKMIVEHWLDRRDVYMLNTYIPHEMKTNESTNPKESKLKPHSVHLYNKSMGAVDLADQITKPFVAERRTMKWYKKLFFHLVDVAVYNALQIYNNYREKKDQKCFKDFLLVLINEIFETDPTARPLKGRKLKIIDFSAQQRLTGVHLPTKCVKENGKSKNQKCLLCSLKGERHETPYKCKTCNEHFCIQADRECFYNYHSMPIIPTKKARVLEERLHYL